MDPCRKPGPLADVSESFRYVFKAILLPSTCCYDLWASHTQPLLVPFLPWVSSKYWPNLRTTYQLNLQSKHGHKYPLTATLPDFLHTTEKVIVFCCRFTRLTSLTLFHRSLTIPPALPIQDAGCKELTLKWMRISRPWLQNIFSLPCVTKLVMVLCQEDRPFDSSTLTLNSPMR